MRIQLLKIPLTGGLNIKGTISAKSFVDWEKVSYIQDGYSSTETHFAQKKNREHEPRLCVIAITE